MSIVYLLKFLAASAPPRQRAGRGSAVAGGGQRLAGGSAVDDAGHEQYMTTTTLMVIRPLRILVCLNPGSLLRVVRTSPWAEWARLACQPSRQPTARKMITSPKTAGSMTPSRCDWAIGRSWRNLTWCIQRKRRPCRLAGLAGRQTATDTQRESPRMNEALTAETISMTGHGGDQIEAYLATAARGWPVRQRGGDPPHARL